MGLMDLFSKEGRQQRSLHKNIGKAANKKIKPDDRRPALYALVEDGSDEAVLGLLKRFTYIYDTNMVMDEEEKKYVYEALVSMGDRILPPVRQHLKTSPTLSWGLRLVNDLCDHETVWSVLEELLQEFEPGYERDPSRKDQLMTFLGDFADERSVKALIPYLEDDDEGVRFTTVESLFRQGDEAAREPLLALLTEEDEESLRIKHRIVEGLAEQRWTVKGFRGTVEKLVAAHMPEFAVDGKGRIKRKKARRD